MKNDNDIMREGVSSPHSVDETPWPPIGTKLGAFRLVGELGTGGQARVYKAIDVRLNRAVALKVLKLGTFANDIDKSRFEREILVQANMRIPGVIPVFERGEDKGWVFFAMELVEGIRLDSVLKDSPRDVTRILRLTAQVADVVAALHDHGVAHRDVKPGNVIVQPDGTVKLIDFGLVEAKRFQFEARLTKTGCLNGTPAYMAPEQFPPSKGGKRKALEPFAVDVYSLGMMTYELLTGRPPYDIEHLDTPEVAVVIKTEPPAAMVGTKPGITPKMEKIVFSALSKDPRKRPTAKAFAKALRACQPGLEKTSKNRGGFAWAAVAACVGFLAYAAFACCWPTTSSLSQTNEAREINSTPPGARPTSVKTVNVQPKPTGSHTEESPTLRLNEPPEDLRGAWTEKMIDLRRDPLVKGMGALLYVLPNRSELTLVDERGVEIMNERSPFVSQGCFYARPGQALTLKFRMNDQIEPMTLTWTPLTGVVSVFN